MGTTWSVRGAAPAGVEIARVQAALEDAFAFVIRQMSHWEPDSELGRFNRAPAGSWQAVSPECFHVLTRACEVAAASGGACDPTMGEVVAWHGCGPDFLATAATLEQAAARSGWEKLRLDPPARRVFQPGGLCLDLSSIAKGFAVDLAAARLAGEGVAHCLIEIGGELRGHGCKPDGSPWWVALEKPDAALPETLIALCGLSAATSGNALRRHLIDPRTAAPAANGLASVTVLAAECLDADAWATALFVAGPVEGPRLAARHRLAALFTVREPGQPPRECWTPALAAMMEDEA